MSADVLETRLHHCEENVKGITDQCKDIAHQIQENERTLYRVTVLQEMTEKKVTTLEHKMKNNDAVLKMMDSEHEKIRTKIRDAEIEKTTKKKFYKNSSAIILFVFTVVNLLAVAYDRLSEHFSQ